MLINKSARYVAQHDHHKFKQGNKDKGLTMTTEPPSKFVVPENT